MDELVASAVSHGGPRFPVTGVTGAEVERATAGSSPLTTQKAGS